MIYAKNAGAWAAVSQIKATTDGISYSAPKAMYVKYNGAWKQLVPPNMVVLYTSSAQYSGKANVYTAVATDKAVLGSSSHSTTSSGATTHSQHDAAANSMTDGYPIGTPLVYKDVLGTITSYWYTTANRTHMHVIGGHSHPNAGTNMNYDRYKLIPTLGGTRIYTGAVVLGTTALSGSLTNVSSTVGGYLHLATTAGAYDRVSVYGKTAGIHGHGSVSPSCTSSGAPDTSTGSWGTYSTTFGFTHAHSTSHDVYCPEILPYYINFIPYQTTADLFLDDLPSGTVMLFTSAALPPGWSRYTSADGRLVKLYSSAGGTGGSSTHTHAGDVRTGDWTSVSSLNSWLVAGTEFGTGRQAGHTHTWSDQHLTSRNHMPPYYPFVLGKKD